MGDMADDAVATIIEMDPDELYEQIRDHDSSRRAMATTKMTNSKPSIARAAPAAAGGAKRLEEFSLPTERSVPVDDINQYSGLIIGEPGIGKTTLSMQEDDVFLLTFDPFQKSLRAFQRHVPDWKTFMGYLKTLEEAAAKGKFPYKRVIVDGADLWFRSCSAWVCEKLVVEHPTEAPWGKGTDFLNSTFGGAIDRLLRLPCGIWSVAHAKWREVEKRDGTKIEKLAPVLQGRAEEILVGKFDLMINYHYEGTARIGTIRGSETIAAKCRIDERFRTPGGEQVVEIVMGNKGPAEAWERLMMAFNNEQPYTTYKEFLSRQQQRAKGANNGKK